MSRSRPGGRVASYVGKGVAVAAGLYAADAAVAADKNIYPNTHATTPWSFDDVNRFLDPVTCADDGGGPYGESCPADGDTIIFNGHADGSEGIYTPPSGPPAQYYNLKTNNVNLTCNNAHFEGGYAASQALMLTDSGGNTIYGCTFKGGIGQQQRGVIARSGFDPLSPITITGNTFEDLEKAVVWWNVPANTQNRGASQGSVSAINDTPGVYITGNHIKNNTFGALFDDPIGTDQTVFGIFANNTVEGLRVLGFQPVLHVDNSQRTSSVLLVARGMNQFDNNIFINSDGYPLPPEVYDATPDPLNSTRSNRGTAAQEVGPDNNGEFQIANGVPDCPPDPEPGSACYQGSLQEWYGGENFTENPGLHPTSRRPMPGSLAMQKRAGAFTPIFDGNGNWEINYADFPGEGGFRRAFRDSNQGTLSDKLGSPPN